MAMTSIFLKVIEIFCKNSILNFYRAHLIILVRNRKENISDHRLIEYEVMRLEPNIRIDRLKLTDVSERGKLDENMKLFMYISLHI